MRLSTSLLKQKLRNSDWKTFINIFNKVHNSHLLNTKLGIIAIKINDKKKTKY